MPINLLRCSCGYQFDQFFPTFAAQEKILRDNDGTLEFHVPCPECEADVDEGAEVKPKLCIITEVNFNFANPVGTDRWQDHDYRFKHNLPNVIAQREAAERQATQRGGSGLSGTKPYRVIDDISSGKNFGQAR